MGLFDNVRSVVLNNKMIKSIKTTDGDVIYEKTSSEQIPTVIQISVDNPIITKNEVSTLTITVLDQDGDVVPNCTLSYSAKHGSTDVASGTLARTDNNGQATVSYTGTGIGDVDFTFTYNANGTLLQETYELEDCLYWNDGSDVHGLDIGTGVSCTSNGEYITITTSTSGEKNVKLPNILTSSDNWEYSLEIAEIGNTQSLAVNLASSNVWAGHGDLNNNWFLQSTNVLIRPTNVGDVIRFTKNGNNITMTINNDMGSNTQSFTFPSTYWIGLYTNNGRIQKVKNIKLKVLEGSRTPTDLTVTGDKSIIQKTETATITALLECDGSPVYNERLSYNVKHGSSVIDSGTLTTDSNGEASITYTGTGIGDVSVEVNYSTLLQKTFVIEDLYWYSNDGTKLNGTYSTGSDSSYSYITDIQTDVTFPDVPIGNFELSMKVYRPSVTARRSLLVEMGVSKSDTLLCGWDVGNYSYSKNVRIYRRSGSSNTSVQNNTNPSYNNDEWIDFKLRFENGTVTLTIGETSISTTRDIVSRIGIYDQSTSRISEIKIKTLYSGTPTDLTLTGDKSIIQKTETATITALLEGNGLPVYNQSLNYSVKHGSTTIDTGTVATDTDGEATISYLGTGVGDVSIEVSYGSLLQKTYEIVDADIYLPLTSDISPYMQSKPSAFSVSYSSDGMYISSSSYATWYMNSQYAIPKSVEFELKAHTSSAPLIQFANGIYVEFKSNKTSIDLNGTTYNVTSTLGKWRFEVYSNEIKAYKDNTLVGTKTINMNTLELAIAVSGSRNCTLKDLIIKAL